MPLSRDTSSAKPTAIPTTDTWNQRCARNHSWNGTKLRRRPAFGMSSKYDHHTAKTTRNIALITT